MYPVLFTIGDFDIRLWGIFVSLGIIAGLWLAIVLARGTEFTEEVFGDFLIWGILAGFVGARLWEVAFSWEQYVENPLHALMFWEGGLSIQGAVIGALIAALLYTRRNRLKFWRFADYAAPGLILGQALGRIGCFFNGDAYGQPTTSWYGVVYQPGTPAFAKWGNIPLTPAELFEAILDFAILGILLYFFKRRTFDGQITLLYLLLYSLARFSLEFFRSDSLLIGEWKVAQITALVMAAGALGVLYYRNRYKTI